MQSPVLQRQRPTAGSNPQPVRPHSRPLVPERTLALSDVGAEGLLAAGSSHEVAPLSSVGLAGVDWPCTLPMAPTQTGVLHLLTTVKVRVRPWPVVGAGAGPPPLPPPLAVSRHCGNIHRHHAMMARCESSLPFRGTAGSCRGARARGRGKCRHTWLLQAAGGK